MSTLAEEAPDLAPLRQLVRQTVDQKLEAGEVVRKRWLLHELMQKQPKAERTALAYLGMSTLVDADIRKRHKQESDEPSEQGVLAGLDDEIRKSYSITRNGEPCIVPTDQMTAAELREKEQELGRIQEGLGRHRRALRRLADEREQEEKAAKRSAR